MAEKPKLCRFRADKSAQRILAESIARELGPLGIHVAYVLIDAAIDTPTMRKRFPEASNDFFHKAIRHCRRALAPLVAQLGMVVPDRTAGVRRKW